MYPETRSSRRRVRFRRRSFELRKNLAQRHDQLVPRDMAFRELYPEFETLILRLELKKERPRPLRTALLIAPFASRFIARQSALKDSMHHLYHLLFGWLSRNLQQQRLRDNP